MSMNSIKINRGKKKKSYRDLCLSCDAIALQVVTQLALFNLLKQRKSERDREIEGT